MDTPLTKSERKAELKILRIKAEENYHKVTMEIGELMIKMFQLQNEALNTQNEIAEIDRCLRTGGGY